jgi:hypothetical protein
MCKHVDNMDWLERHKPKLRDFNINLKYPEQPLLVTRKESATGNVASAIFYLRFYVKSAGHVFQGNAGGISTPGGGALFGDLYINDESIFEKTTNFEFNAASAYCSLLFFDNSHNLLGHAEFGGVSTIAGIGGGTGSWQKE